MALCQRLLRSSQLLRPSLRGAVGVQKRMLAGESQDLVLTSIDQSGVATLQLNRPPVNGMSLELLTEFCIALDKLDGEKACHGIILTSAKSGIFCAGLDITEMHNPSEARLREFWRSFQEMWIKLYSARQAVVAAVNGHSPAGGCVLAMSCDHRIMASGKFSMGLNETKLGIVAPSWVVDLMVNTVGLRQAERGLQLGHLYGAEEALHVGLVDQLVPLDQVLPTAQKQMEQWLQIPAAARQLSKLALRQPFVDKLRRKQQEDTDSFVKFVLRDSVQKTIDVYLASLKKKK